MHLVQRAGYDLERIGQLQEERGRAVRIGSVVIDCNDFERMDAFWREAPRYAQMEPSRRRVGSDGGP